MKLKLDNIQLKDLFDTGTIQDPQDPVVTIFIAGKEFSTKRHVDAGTEAVFTDIFEIDIDPYEYKDGKLELEVEVINLGSEQNIGTQIKAIHVGRGRATLRSVIPNLESETYFIVDLTHYSRKGNYRKGECLMRGVIRDPDAIKDALRFKEIELENLKKSYEEYIISSKQLEHEMEVALQKADTKIQKLNNKQLLTTTQLNEITERYTQISEDYTTIYTELLMLRESKANEQNETNHSQIQANNELIKKVATLTSQNEALQQRLRNQEQDATTMQTELDEVYTSKYELELVKNDEIATLKKDYNKLVTITNKSNEENTKVIIDLTEKITSMAKEIQELRSSNSAATMITYNNTYINNSTFTSTVVNNSYFESIVNSTNITNIHITNVLSNTNIDEVKSELITEMKKSTALTVQNAKLLSRIQSVTGNMLVCVRARPASDEELFAGGKLCIDASDSTDILCYDKSATTWKGPFTFDAVWGYDASQQDIFSDLEPLVASVTGPPELQASVAGGSDASIVACILSYGQHNSGKSFTMNGFPQSAEHLGLRLLALQKVFDLLNNKQQRAENIAVKTSERKRSKRLSVDADADAGAGGGGAPDGDGDMSSDETVSFDFTVEVSFYQIRTEKIIDLFAAENAPALSNLTHDAETNITSVSGLTNRRFTKASEAMLAVSQVITERLMVKEDSATMSSLASHTVLTITVTTHTTMTGDNEKTTTTVKNQLHLVDLASAEYSDTDVSLAALHRVLTALQHQGKNDSVSVDAAVDNGVVLSDSLYENSKLTSLLRTSLAGVSGHSSNAKTALILTVNPTDLSLQQSLNNLQFVSNLRDAVALGQRSGVSGGSARDASNTSGGASKSNNKAAAVEIKNMKVKLSELTQRKTHLESVLTETKTTATSLIDQWKTQYFESITTTTQLKESNTQVTLDLNLTQRNLKRVLEQFKEQCSVNERLVSIIRIYEKELEIREKQALPSMCVCVVLDDEKVAVASQSVSSKPAGQSDSNTPAPLTPSGADIETKNSENDEQQISPLGRFSGGASFPV